MRWAETRAVFAVLGRPVLVRATATGTGVAILAAIIFAPSGVRAADVARWMHASIGWRAALWAGWTLLSMPLAGAAFDAPGAKTLRTLVPRRALVLHVTALLTVAQSPWALLTGAGGAPLAGASSALLAVAVEASALAALRRPRHAILTSAALALVLADLPPLFTFVPAALLAYASTSAAFRSVAVARPPLLRLTRPTRPVLALAAVYLLALVRAARARLATSAVFVALGGAALHLSFRNDPPLRPISRALLWLTLPLCAAAGTLVAPALAAEARLRALLRATRTPSRVLLGGLALALAAPSSAMAATSSALAVSAAGWSPWLVASAAFAWAALLAILVAAWARRHDRTARRDPSLFVLGVILIASVMTWVGSW